MRAAGFILTGQRIKMKQAHPPIILTRHVDEQTKKFVAPTDLLGQLYTPIDCEHEYPAFHNFNVWPATKAVLDALAETAHLPGEDSLDGFAAWKDPATRRLVICTREERGGRHI